MRIKDLTDKIERVRNDAVKLQEMKELENERISKMYAVKVGTATIYSSDKERIKQYENHVTKKY